MDANCPLEGSFYGNKPLVHKFLAKELVIAEQTAAEQKKGCDHFFPVKAILDSVVNKLVLNATVSLIFRIINFQWGVDL